MTPVIEMDYGAMLNEARAAYHALSMGQSAREYVDQNGERVTYTVANRGALAAYIVQLERLCGIGTSTGPLNVWM